MAIPRIFGSAAVLSFCIVFTLPAQTTGTQCSDLPAWDTLQTALKTARATSNGGFNLDMWATVVNRDGVVCAVAYTGAGRGDQWPGSRVIQPRKQTPPTVLVCRPGSVDSQPVYRCSAWRFALRSAAQ